MTNTSNSLQGVARIIAFPWLTELNEWYLLKADVPIPPNVEQQEGASGTHPTQLARFLARLKPGSKLLVDEATRAVGTKRG